jgi:hypothetical protein
MSNYKSIFFSEILFSLFTTYGTLFLVNFMLVALDFPLMQGSLSVQ